MTNQEIKANLERFRVKMDARNVVCGDGPIPCKLMLVGEAPGENEDIQDLPFVGRAGDLLTKLLERAGLVRDQLYITNTVKCRPKTADNKNRPPNEEEIQACKRCLWEEIKAVNPSVIVTLGAVSTGLLAQQKKGFKMGPLVGRVFTLSDKYRIMPIWHPSYLLRGNRKAYDDALECFKTVKGMI